MSSYLITFPAENIADVRSFPSLATAEKAAGSVQMGAAYVLSSLTEQALSALPLAALTIIHNTARPDNQVKTLRTKAAATARVLPLIESMATPVTDSEPEEESTMATTEKKKGRTRKPKQPKATSTDGKGTPGRDPMFAGKVIIRTEKGNGARRNETSRRTATWNLIPNGKTGIKYETLLEKGGHKADIIILARLGHIEAK